MHSTPTEAPASQGPFWCILVHGALVRLAALRDSKCAFWIYLLRLRHKWAQAIQYERILRQEKSSTSFPQKKERIASKKGNWLFLNKAPHQSAWLIWVLGRADYITEPGAASSESGSGCATNWRVGGGWGLPFQEHDRPVCVQALLLLVLAFHGSC